LVWLRVAAGDLPGTGVEVVAAVVAGLESGNANAGDDETVADADADGDGVPLGEGEGLGVGLGVGEGAIIFSQ
jgi:hypothetical protein